MDCSKPSFLVLHYLPKFAQTQVHQVGDTIQLSHPLSLFLLPSIFPSIRVFSNELALHTRWPNYWSFSIHPSNEYSGLISFMIDWFDLLASKGLSRVFSSTTLESIHSSALSLLHFLFFCCCWRREKGAPVSTVLNQRIRLEFGFQGFPHGMHVQVRGGLAPP